jgi:hypothetical protein
MLQMQTLKGRDIAMTKRLVATIVIALFILATTSACLVKPLPPGQLKKHLAPGHQKKRH